MEKCRATYSTILVWRIPRIEEPGGLQSMGLQSQTRLNRLNIHISLDYKLSKGRSHFTTFKKPLWQMLKNICELNGISVSPEATASCGNIRAGALCSFVHSITQQRFAGSLLDVRHRAWDMPFSNFHIKFKFPLQIMFY